MLGAAPVVFMLRGILYRYIAFMWNMIKLFFSFSIMSSKIIYNNVFFKIFFYNECCSTHSHLPFLHSPFAMFASRLSDSSVSSVTVNVGAYITLRTFSNSLQVSIWLSDWPLSPKHCILGVNG